MEFVCVCVPSESAAHWWPVGYINDVAHTTIQVAHPWSMLLLNPPDSLEKTVILFVTQKHKKTNACVLRVKAAIF